MGHFKKISRVLAFAKCKVVLIKCTEKTFIKTIPRFVPFDGNLVTILANLTSLMWRVQGCHNYMIQVSN